jgi:NAD-dependent deacetylase
VGNIVILTGAGVSAESGIATFRDADGLWEQHRVEDVATPEGFARDPLLVHRFYNQRRAQLRDVAPNPGHLALAELERAWAGVGTFTLVTQNVDDLHERGGSAAPIHMHGELRRALCQGCGASSPWEADLGPADACPACGKPGGLRPDIVWFGEMPYRMAEIKRAVREADIFVAVGTSGRVYPAAGLVREARENGRGCVTIEVNPDPTGDGAFALTVAETAGEGLPKLSKALPNL